MRTLLLSEDLGGAGADTLTCCIVTEELAVGDPDTDAQTRFLAAQRETAPKSPLDRRNTGTRRESG